MTPAHCLVMWQQRKAQRAAVNTGLLLFTSALNSSHKQAGMENCIGVTRKRQQMSATPNKAVLTMPGLQGMGWWQCAGGCLVSLPENAITRQEKAFWSQSWRGVFPGASFLASAVGDSC